MTNLQHSFGVFSSLFIFSSVAHGWDPTVFVDPEIGTANDGQVNPGAVAPFGMIQWSPDTPNSPVAAYLYADHETHGMSLTHMSGTGCPNAAELPILPTVGPGNIQNVIGFQHSDEQAAVGYYRVVLANGVKVELTATPRTGMARYTFPPTADANLLIDATRNSTGTAEGEIKTGPGGEITGWTRGGHFCSMPGVYTVYFAARVNRPFAQKAITGGKLLATFDTRSASQVLLKVAISYVSVENARQNLEAENPGWNFDTTRGGTAEAWRQKLSAIQVSGGLPDQLKVFYTALYHALLHPNLFSDVNGDYIGFDGKTRKSGSRPHYANFSGWDIYRSQLQLVTWLFPEIGAGIAQSFVDDASQCGALPKWSQNNVENTVMVGDPGAAAVASIYAFGGKDFDAKSALSFMLKSGLENGAACNGLLTRPANDGYQKLGYVAAGTPGIWGVVATTLEYAIADFAVSSFAKALGDRESETKFGARSASWRNLFNPATGLIEAKTADGAWVGGVTESTTDGYVEGSAFQYLWSVPQDAHQLIVGLGGDAAAVSRLDRFFTKLNAGADQPYEYIGNEPGFWAPWYYLWAHAPARTQDVVRRIVEECFHADPAGLPGNDDMGATSSWLVWSSLGLFPMVPGVSGLAIASPLFPYITVHLGDDRTLVMESPAAPLRYVSALTVDGHPSDKPWLDEGVIAHGAKLKFDLTDKPTNWGSVDF